MFAISLTLKKLAKVSENSPYPGTLFLMLHNLIRKKCLTFLPPTRIGCNH
jgi:hypothetical protein